ncbi:class I SAM-dependent methyltransferase [Nocardia wallacei]|uniref:class I SAM-dependent methyltransferase n=1 Tax=Nocardia wallacei TaxID=480035 RepID=UPI00245506A8|nr:class I SAM-dependent methyltransferase [Nocardia wallacei]
MVASTERFEWIADLMSVRPNDLILEIGAGSSPSVAHLAARLTTGRIVAADRSETAVRRSAERHAALIDSGRLRLLHAALEQLPTAPDLEGLAFDKVLAMNVNLFWTRPCARELTFIHNVLTPDGALYLCYGYGTPTTTRPESPKPPPAQLTHNLTTSGFTTELHPSGDLLTLIARKHPRP